ncbi:MAG TPA: DUF2252 family protein, partial [Gemmatimonadaceae bacterium]|nr:DUF2252 family protein [Gemmatimonadaceae bacterium]
RGDNRLAYFDLNDFDEAALAPATWELARFVTSVHLAAAKLRLSAADATNLSKTFISAYSDSLADGKARWVERTTAKGMVRDLLRGIKQRRSEDLLNVRTEMSGTARKLKVDGRHALKLLRHDRAEVVNHIHAFGEARGHRKFYRVLDVARRVAGTGSLGLRRFVVLVRGHGVPDGSILLDIKEAGPSALAPHVAVPQPPWKNEADRVVHVQRRMQAISPALLEVVSIGDRHCMMRELQPFEDRLALEHWHGKLRRLQRVMTTMGEAVAWAQLRSASRQGSAGADDLIAFAHTRGWRRELLKYARQYARTATRDWRQFSALPEKRLLSRM